MSRLHVKYLLVGGGLASSAAAGSIRAIDASGSILMLGQEPVLERGASDAVKLGDDLQLVGYPVLEMWKIRFAELRSTTPGMSRDRLEQDCGVAVHREVVRIALAGSTASRWLARVRSASTTWLSGRARASTRFTTSPVVTAFSAAVDQVIVQLLGATRSR